MKPLELKKEWEIEKKRLEQRIIDIKVLSKEFWGGDSYILVTADQFKELENMVPVLDGKITQPRYTNSICESCKVMPPVVEFWQESNRLSFINPPPFSHISFYLTLDIPKQVVLREFEKFYDQALTMTSNLEERKGNLWRLIQRSLLKKEHKCHITRPIEKCESVAELYHGFGCDHDVYRICEACEPKEIVEKLRVATLENIEYILSLLDLNKKDYQANIRVQKEKIW